MDSKWHVSWFWFFFAITSFVFFLGTLLLPLASRGDVFVSPDETANAFFARHLAESGTLRVLDSVTHQFNNQLYPRSVLAIEGVLLPQSFLGLPVLYGVLASIFGPEILLFLTPVLAILAALAFRAVLKQWLPAPVADLSAILFLVHPAVWYYSARGLMHNVLFVSLLLFAAYVFFHHPIAHHLERCLHRFGKMRTFQRHTDCLLAGFLVGLALFVRTSEAYWVGVVLMIFTVVYGRKQWRELARVWVGAVIGCLLILFFNTLTYTHPFVTGYTAGAPKTAGTIAQPIAHEATRFVFPFGLDLVATAEHVVDYGILLFWWLSLLALIGFAIAAAKHKWYAVSFILLAAWLGIWYGSWTLNDNPDVTQVTMANSYVRYWLPVFIASIPLIAEGMLWIAHRARSIAAQRLCVAALMVLVVGLNLRLVFFEGQDALMRMANVLMQSREIKADVLSRTESDAVIIVDRGDKLFFPERRVRYPLRSEQTYALMPQITESYPLYYYGITLPEKDITFLNTSKLPELGLQIEWIKTYGEESLYKIGHNE